MVAVDGSQTQSPITGKDRELGGERHDHLSQRKVLQMRFLRAGIQTRDVQQTAQKVFACDERPFGLGDQRRVGRREVCTLDGRYEQTCRGQRLHEIV